MDHPHDLRPADPDAPSGGEHLHRAPTRRDRSVVVAALLVTAGLVTVAAVVGLRGLAEDAAPRQLRVDAPRGDAPASVAATDDVGAEGDDAAVSELARRVLDPSAPAAERAALVDDGGPGRPAARAVFESFDGLAASVGAHVQDATFSVEHLDDDIVAVTADIPMQSDLGSSARLRDLLFHRVGDRWRMTYESLCGLANLAPLMGGTSACPGSSALHHDAAVPDLTRLLVEDAPEIERGTPIDLAYGYSSSARTGRWAWLVDYPEQELGGGAPSSPAELVRVDATTGEETGRVRLVGTEPSLAGDGDVLWVLQHHFDGTGAWLDPHLTRVDPATLQIVSDTTVPGATVLQASGDVAWTLGEGGVRRFRASGDGVAEDLRPWNGEAVSTVDEYQLSTAATPEGLWILPSDALGASGADAQGVLIDADTMEARPLALPRSTLVVSGSQLWAQDSSDPSLLRRVAADGSVLATVSSPVGSSGQVWGDGRGGLWVVGDALPSGDCCEMLDYAVTRRAMAAHLDDTGAAVGSWWSTGTVPNGPDWFTRFGDGLGWTSLEGIELLSP